MTFVFFIYGLSFFVLGLSILVYPKKGSAFKLARHLYLVAGFGLIHGMNEWVDMFILVVGPVGRPGLTSFLEASRMLFLPGSFLFLLQFGTKVIAESKKKYSSLKTLPMVLLVIWVVIFATSEDRFTMGDIWSRYLLCFPGTILTAYGLILCLPQFKKTESPAVTKSLKLGAVIFFLYGVLAGLIVKKADFFPASVLNYDVILRTVGVPVQVFRGVCAAILAYSILRILSIFRWEAQNTLLDSELRFRTIAAAVPVILFMEDREGLITFLEGKGLDTLGGESSQFVGRPVSSLFPGVSLAGQEGRHLRPGETYNSNITVENRTFDLCYSPVQDSRGEISGFIGVALDVTERMRAQAELEKNRQEMMKTKHLTELGTISTAMTRELDRPLKVAQLLLERLLKDIAESSYPEAVAKTVRKSFSEVTEAVSVLMRFYDFARLQPAAEAKPIDLLRFAERIIAVCADSARRVNLELVTEGLDVVPRIRMVERHLEYIFFVLIQNAIDLADGSRIDHLTISCQIHHKQMRLTFADTCRGIPNQQLENIFQPFLAAQPNGRGVDIELAVVNHIAGICGGSIRVESEPGKGTAFCLTLPIE